MLGCCSPSTLILHIFAGLGASCDSFERSRYWKVEKSDRLAGSRTRSSRTWVYRAMSEKSLFQKIIDREVDADIVHEDDRCVAFRDIDPQAPTHILIVPRKPIPTLNDLEPEDEKLVGHLFVVAQDLAQEEGLRDGYRTVINCGDDGGQSVYHLHLHLLGGRRMSWPPG